MELPKHFVHPGGSKLVAKWTWACLAMQTAPWEEVGGLRASPQTPGWRPGQAMAVWVAGLPPHSAQCPGRLFLAA